MEGDVIVLQDLYLFDYGMGIDEDGKFLGQLKSTGIRPQLHASGWRTTASRSTRRCSPASRSHGARGRGDERRLLGARRSAAAARCARRRDPHRRPRCSRWR